MNFYKGITMAYQISQIQQEDGRYRTFIPPSEHNFNKASREVAKMTNNWKCIHWTTLVTSLGLLVCTLSLITCAFDGCFDDSDDQVIKSVCDTFCSESTKITAIVGEVIFGLGALLFCCIMVKTRK